MCQPRPSLPGPHVLSSSFSDRVPPPVRVDQLCWQLKSEVTFQVSLSVQMTADGQLQSQDFETKTFSWLFSSEMISHCHLAIAYGLNRHTSKTEGLRASAETGNRWPCARVCRGDKLRAVGATNGAKPFHPLPAAKNGIARHGQRANPLVWWDAD